MKIVLGVYYYYPYVSGLTVYARFLAESLAARGHEVIVVTSRHDRALPVDQVMNGVRVRRVSVWFRADKGVIMPGFVPAILSLGRSADVVNLHLPMAEAGAVAAFAGRKLVVTYQCDVRLNSRNWLGLAVERLSFASMELAIRRSQAVAALSFDYAANSRLLSRHLDKVVPISPPIRMPDPTAAQRYSEERFRARADVPEGARTIGFLGRIVFEKGIDFLVHAFFDVAKQYPDAYLLVGGDYSGVAGGSVKHSLDRHLAGRQQRVRFLGPLTDDEVDAFYRFIDLLALPSIDPLEAYGMVQVEAMLRGTPVVATDLPGVRSVVQRTGMGLVVPARNPHALALGLMRGLSGQDGFCIRTPQEIWHLLDLGHTAEDYEELFRHVVSTARA